MSLSGIRQLFIIMVLLLASAWTGREYAAPVYSYLTDGRSIDVRDARIKKRSITYRIRSDGPVTFAFSQPVRKAKILVHLSVEERLRNLEAGFVYGIRLRWLDANGDELSAHDAYFQADAPDQVFESGIVWRFFRTQAELIAEQDSLIVESPAPATWLQIEAFDTDPGIVGIDARVFEQRTYIGNQSLSIFRRLSDDSKALLTASNAFPATMLTEEEQRNLGKNFWRPVGPLGIDGRDYQKMVLYEAVIERSPAGEGVLPL